MSKPSRPFDNTTKTICQTPTEGKQPTRIPTWKYLAMRRAILASLPSEAPGLPFSKLRDVIATQLTDAEQTHMGSLGWHCTVVKLDMECKGEIQRLENVSPQQLIRLVPFSQAYKLSL